MILPCQRHLFDIPADICYLNAAYMTPLTVRQRAAGQDALNRCMQPWSVTPDDFFKTIEPVKQLSAELFGVQTDDMAIVPSVSYGIATAGKNLSLHSGEQILVLDSQFPSNVYEWRDLAEEHGGSVYTLDNPDNHDWTSAIITALEDKSLAIKIVALPNVHWSSGAVIDLVAVSVACKMAEAALVLDLTQSAGAVPINLSDVDPDFAVIGGYKWMMGPYSMGVMYVAPRRQKGIPLEQNWIARKDSENFSRLVDYKDTYQPGATRFDVGEKSNFILSPIYVEGIRQLLEWGVENTAETIAEINNELASICTGVGFDPVQQQYRSPNMLGVYVGERAPDVMNVLKEHNISAGIRGEMLRLAPHLWVNDSDIKIFKTAMNIAAKI